MRYVLIAMLWATLATGAVAQEAPSQRQLELAERFIELSQGDGLGKMVDQVIETEMANAEGLSGDQRQWIERNVPAIMTRHLERLVGDLVPVFAQRLTEEELAALVTFYEGPHGRSIAQKQLEIGVAQGEQMNQFILAFMTDFQTKFCAEFDCPESGVAAAPSKRTN